MSQAYERLAYPLKRWIRQKGWSALHPIQEQAIEAMYEGPEDVVIAAPTAGGKTEAAFLPLVSQIIAANSSKLGFSLLYIGPLRALITDQAERLHGMCEEAELPIIPWHSDVSSALKQRAYKSPRGILLITPESLESMLMRRWRELGRLFANTQAIVLDELHSLLDSERGVQLRSILARLERALGRRLRRVGLSATLGDMRQACAYVCPEAPERVRLIQGAGGGAELKLQVRGYRSEKGEEELAKKAVAEHLFKCLRGSNNLVFAGSRHSVEYYTDTLGRLCEERGLPQEFYAHHGSLAGEHRNFVETRLKEGQWPTTAICTSTLEMGVDIGDIHCIGQIGAPFSVASLRQRLGRSGRRAGKPAILRQYCLSTSTRVPDLIEERLHLDLVRAIAMIELLLTKWCEPARAQSLHLSTLVHQVLATLCSWGAGTAATLYRMLCEEGPFRQVSRATFVELLRAIARPDVELLSQASDGALLLGKKGEVLVKDHSFYAVFPTPEEYQLVVKGRSIGTLPVDHLLAPGMVIVFSGRHWHIDSIEQKEKTIALSESKHGKPPSFGGEAGLIHDRVIEAMFALLESGHVPGYLDPVAQGMLEEARDAYLDLGFERHSVIGVGANVFVLATRCGSLKNNTLALALGRMGCQVKRYDGFLEVVGPSSWKSLKDILNQVAHASVEELIDTNVPLSFEPYHPYLTFELQRLDAFSARLDMQALPSLCHTLVEDMKAPRFREL